MSELDHAVAPYTSATQPPALPAARIKPVLSQRQKAAVIVRLLLREGAQLRLDELPEAMQVDLTREMGALRLIDRDTLKAVVTEFVGELTDLGMTFPGGLSGALEALDGALSPDCMQKLRQHTGLPVRGDPWQILAALPVDKLAETLRAESAEIAAVVLSKLPVKQSAAVLAHLPGDTARRITYAVSQTAGIDPDTVRTIGLAIASQIASATPTAFPEAPVARIGAILNSSNAATRDSVLTGLDADDADLAIQVRKAIFTFTNIPERIAARDIPKIARAVDPALLITALAAALRDPANAPAAEYVFDNMSQRLATQIRGDIEDLDPVKPAEGEEAMEAVVTAIRDMEQAGEITLGTED
jgi:flagellar motor switch protein FliG